MSAANDRGRLRPVCIVFPRRTGPGSGCPLSMFLNTPLGLAVSVLRSGGRSLDCVQLNFQLRLRCVDLAMSSHLGYVYRLYLCFELQAAFRTNTYLRVLQATMAAGLFSFSSLTYRPRLNISLQPAFDIKTMITIIIGYLSDYNFVTPPMRVNAAVREFIFM
jgi:hypothetical protein